jgi:hypothetical protein
MTCKMDNSLIMRYILLGFIVLIGLRFFRYQEEFTSNREFLLHLDEYLQYVDSTKEYTDDFDYIYVEATSRFDSTFFLITLMGGSYTFIDEMNRIKNFIRYKDFNLLFVGDYPNQVIDIRPDKKIDIINDILKKYYKEDYDKYQKDPGSIVPMIYDYMSYNLTYKQDKLISTKKQYY